MAEGLAKTAGVITGAALIMVTVFAAFALAEVITIKSIGVGMAIAVFVDATIIRVLLVPATMRLMGRLELVGAGTVRTPGDRLGFSHAEDEEVPPGHARRLDGPGGVRWHLMDERPDSNVTRIAAEQRRPRPGGCGSGRASGKVYTWEWGPDQARRPGLPWIGVFLLVFGGLLLAARGVPGGTLARVAPDPGRRDRLPDQVGHRPRHGLALCRRRSITALAVPGVLTDAGLDLDGLGTFCFGVAFLFIAAVRAASGGGFGWQAWFGGLLALLGGVNMLSADRSAGLIVAVTLVAIGAVLVFGGAFRGCRAASLSEPWVVTRRPGR